MSDFFESLTSWLPELSWARTVDTAIGAFMGAATVTIISEVRYWRMRKKEEMLARTEAINRTLFVLLTRIIVVRGYKSTLGQHLEEDNDMRLVPPLDTIIDEESFEFGNMSWMLESKYRRVLLKVKLGLENYKTFCQLMSHRNHVLLNEIHPRMDNLQLHKKSLISEFDRLPQWLKSRFKTYNNQTRAILLDEKKLDLELEHLFDELRNAGMNLGYKQLISLDDTSPLQITDRDSIFFKPYTNNC